MPEENTAFRDLTLVPLSGDEVMVIACDSLGGIGPKECDAVKAPAEILGRCTARVPLMEVIAAGARPLVVVNTLGVEMEPTGAEVVRGIRAEVEAAGLSSGIVLTGSSEENVKTCQSSLGVTVIGRALRQELRLGRSQPGDMVVCLGRPKVGEEVLDGTPEADVRLVRKLVDVPWVNEILPVGSKGILFEARELAAGANAVLSLLAVEIDMQKSAGPATCLLVTLPERYFRDLEKITNLPVYKIGYLQQAT